MTKEPLALTWAWTTACEKYERLLFGWLKPVALAYSGNLQMEWGVPGMTAILQEIFLGLL